MKEIDIPDNFFADGSNRVQRYLKAKIITNREINYSKKDDKSQ